MEMNIESVLKIDLQLLGEGNGPALVILEDAWEAEGRSTQPAKLIRVLKTTLDRCKLRGITYPRIFLRRKGELTRGEFQPGVPITPGAPIRFAVPQHSKVPVAWLRQATEEFNVELNAKPEVSVVLKDVRQLARGQDSRKELPARATAAMVGQKNEEQANDGTEDNDRAFQPARSSFRTV
jgi:hypothetical protein